MRNLFIGVFLLVCLCFGLALYAGEDAGVAGAAYTKAKNISSSGLTTKFNGTIVASNTSTSYLVSPDGDTDTGLYYNGANDLRLYAGGLVAALNATEVYCAKRIAMADGGTVTSPSIRYFGWTSGFYFPAADSVGVSATGVSVQKWTSKQIYQPAIDSGGILISDTSVKCYKLTTDAAATRLTTDGATDGATNRWGIASGTTLTGQVYVSGIATDSTRASVGYVIGFKAQRVNSTVVIATCSSEIMEDASLTGCSADIAADSTNGAFYVNVIGSTTTNLRWGAVAKYMEVNQP
jgi:hypothetical protein